MAAYAALVSLMNNIEQIMRHPRLSTSLDNNFTQPLVEKAAFLLDYIEDRYHHGRGNKETAEALERRITSAAHAAEDVIESHIVDQIHAGTSEVSLACSLELHRIIQDIDAIITNATEEKHGWRKEKSIHNAAGPLVESGETAMVGLEDEFLELLDKLTGNQSERVIISIVGMGGTGKTTLAKNIYERALVKEHFEIRAWATISQQYNAEEIISKLFSCMGKSTNETSGETLYKTLYGRRYLIVLDDIWSVEAWDKVRPFFPDQGNRSRVVLTTRLSNVANDCGSSCLSLGLLDEDKSWKLFCEKASFPQKNDPPHLEDVGKKIVKSCKGLALSISVIGGLLLKSSRTVEYWMSVASDIKSISDSKEKQEMLDVLSLSYSHLPPHLKPCFLYMGVFKEDSEIKVSNLIKLWVGEGFLKPSESIELEEVAEGYINDMIDRNLMLASRRGSNGKVRYCNIHDLLRDLSLRIAEEQEFVTHWHYELHGLERRLVYGYNVSNRKQVPFARSITGSCRPNGSRLLRVLNTHGKVNCFRGEDYCEYVNLRYLAYNYNPWRVDQTKTSGRDINIMKPKKNSNLTRGRGAGHKKILARTCEKRKVIKDAHAECVVIPASVFLIWNLQTLIVSHSSLAFAPLEFWKMQQLRHVHCNIHLRTPVEEEEVVILEKLQTLKTAVNLILCEEVCKIIPNIKKLHLKYHRDCRVYDESYSKGLSNLNLLQKLESLKLTSDGRDVGGLNEAVRFPSSLKKLSLEGCELDWGLGMSKIGSLPQLEVLILGCNAFTEGEEWITIDGQFLHLKVLRIEFCSLHVWNIADCSHFPVLNKLLLRGLDELEEIPSGIAEIPTLQLIRVESCSASAAVSAVKIKEDRLDFDDDDDLQIQVELRESNLESFMEGMETEKLTINNIQFQMQISDSSYSPWCASSFSLSDIQQS